MTPAEKNGPPEPPPERLKRIPKAERLTAAECKRLIAEAESRGEDFKPILKRFVLGTIDDVIDALEAEPEAPSTSPK